MEPVGHMLCMAAEVALKSFLADHGYSDKKVLKLGHDLKKCLWHAVREGLCLDKSCAECILTMRSVQLSHFYRYGASQIGAGNVGLGMRVLIDEDLAVNEVAKLIDYISGSGRFLRVSHGHAHTSEWPVTPPALTPVTIEVIEAIHVKISKWEKNIEKIGKK